MPTSLTEARERVTMIEIVLLDCTLRIMADIKILFASFELFYPLSLSLPIS